MPASRRNALQHAAYDVAHVHAILDDDAARAVSNHPLSRLEIGTQSVHHDDETCCYFPSRSNVRRRFCALSSHDKNAIYLIRY